MNRATLQFIENDADDNVFKNQVNLHIFDSYN